MEYKKKFTLKDVIYRPKSEQHPIICITTRCGKKATLVAVAGMSEIRCCNNKNCKKRAANLVCMEANAARRISE